MKLTYNQMSALLEVFDGEIKKVKYGSGLWRIEAPIASPSIIGKLAVMGMIYWRKEEDGFKACLTPLGRKTLEENVNLDQEEKETNP